MAAEDLLSRVQPLSDRNGGARYVRDPAIEAEIAAALLLSPMALITRAANRDRRSAEFLREETLVYCLRAYHAAGSQNVVTKLTEALLARCALWIFRRLRALGLGPQDAEDAFSDVVRVMITAITDLSSGRGDFYQVRFARALKLKVLTAYDRQLREVERASQQVAFSSAADATIDEVEDSDVGGSDVRIEIAEPSKADDELLEAEERAERRALLDEILGAIRDPRHREAFVLHRLEGWQITTKEPGQPCLIDYFSVKSAKTIYNWIKQAEADIAAAGFAAREEES